jgi:hypothetical protein
MRSSPWTTDFEDNFAPGQHQSGGLLVFLALDSSAIFVEPRYPSFGAGRV